MQSFSIPFRFFLIPVAVTIAVTTTTAVVSWAIAFSTRTSYGYGQCTSVVFGIVKFFNGMLSFFVVGHFYKTIAF